MIFSARHALLIVSAAALLTACGQNEDVPQQPDANPAATIPTPADETAAPTFVEKAAASDMYEVDAARVAMERSSNAQVDAFAQMMIDAHTASTAALKTAITASALPLVPPGALPADKADMVQDLRDSPANELDRTYMNQQVDAHQATLNLMQRYGNDGDNQSLKDFALATAPTVQSHLDEATRLRDALPDNNAAAPAAK